MRSIKLIGILLGLIALDAAASERDIRNSIVLGAFAFADNCRKCHQVDGYGGEGLYPSLHSPELLANKALLIKTILHGRFAHQEAAAGTRLMPALGYLTNREIAAIIAFITSSWGEVALQVTEEEVEAAR